MARTLLWRPMPALSIWGHHDGVSVAPGVYRVTIIKWDNSSGREWYLRIETPTMPVRAIVGLGSAGIALTTDKHFNTDAAQVHLVND